MLVDVDENEILNNLDTECLLQELEERGVHPPESQFKRDLTILVDSYLRDSGESFRKNFVTFAKKYSHEAGVFL